MDGPGFGVFAKKASSKGNLTIQATQTCIACYIALHSPFILLFFYCISYFKSLTLFQVQLASYFVIHTWPKFSLEAPSL